MQKLGQTIRKLRIQKDMTIEDLAFQANVTSSHMGCIERGQKTNITLSTLKKIAKALDRKPYEILGYSDYSEFETSCPLQSVLLECKDCKKTGADILKCCNQTGSSTAYLLLTISNACQVQQSAGKKGNKTRRL